MAETLEQRAQLRAAIKQELAETSMEPWAAELCRYVARHPNITKFRVGDTIKRPMLDAASALADRPIRRAELAAIMRTRPWLTLWDRERGGLVDAEVKEAKENFVKLVPTALRVGHKSLKHIEEQLDADDEVLDKDGNVIHVRDKIGAIRAASPLIAKVMDTSIPRAQVGTQLNAQVVNIHITPEQASLLAAPVMVVEAEEVTAEPLDPPQLPAA